ncbi:hypothetical protein [Lactococcus hircilactis]|nr:hypothetical protein [Lactococcus hircilactis]
MNEQIEIDANQLVTVLTNKIAELELENAKLKVLLNKQQEKTEEK